MLNFPDAVQANEPNNSNGVERTAQNVNFEGNKQNRHDIPDEDRRSLESYQTNLQNCNCQVDLVAAAKHDDDVDGREATHDIARVEEDIVLLSGSSTITYALIS